MNGRMDGDRRWDGWKGKEKEIVAKATPSELVAT
jgi:hypothetical protein